MRVQLPQSMLYSAAISTIGWEFGIEACMERPSYQDLIFTPLLGSILGEGFYRLKRLIVSNNYELLGTPVLGHIAAFFLDPVNEVIGLLSPEHAAQSALAACHRNHCLSPHPHRHVIVIRVLHIGDLLITAYHVT